MKVAHSTFEENEKLETMTKNNKGQNESGSRDDKLDREKTLLGLLDLWTSVSLRRIFILSSSLFDVQPP